MLDGFAHLDLDVDGDTPLPAVPARLFAYEHILGLHGPYRPSDAARERLALPAARHVEPGDTSWFDVPLDGDAMAELRAAYRAEGHDADRRFAERVAWMRREGLWDEALVIVTSDHGEAFLEHGLTQHSVGLDEEMVRVPLFVKFPASSAWAAWHAARVPHRVSLADVYPTLIELLGLVPPPYELDGTSLLATLDGRQADPLARDVVMRASFSSEREDGGGYALFVADAMLSGRHKAQFGYRIRSSQDPARHPFAQGHWIASLHDLVADPAETDDLAGRRPELFLRLMAQHRASCAPLVPRTGAAAAPAAAPYEPAAPEELLRRLQQLGYVR
jgi:arylsulfatase A-like enzyme